jgi:uncharacterized protein
MTKILIVSDSHRMTDELDLIKQRHSQEVDYMLHCGDSELSADQREIDGFITVRGNCDYDERFLDEKEINIGGHKIFLTHGHRFAVKSTLMNLYYRAQELAADIVCFGHSHTLGIEQVDGILFINPGSIRLPRGRKEQTYCLLELTREAAKVRVFDLKLGELPQLRQHFPLQS